MVDRPIEEREIEGEPADESNSGPHCCSPPFRAVLGHSPLSIQRRTPEVWWPASGFRLCIFRERYRQSRRRSVRSLRGWERELFSNQIHVKSNKWSSQSVLYNAVLTHRLIPFGITGVAFGSQVRRTLPEGLVIRRTSVWRTLPAGLVVRRTSFGRSPQGLSPSTTGLYLVI